MKQVLLIGSHYGFPESANGVCLKNIANEFQHRGYRVYIISDSIDGKDQMSIEEGVTVYRLKEAWYSQFIKKYTRKNKLDLLYKFISILRKLILIPSYPNVSPIRSKKIFRLANRLIRTNGIQMVLCSYRPYESIYTAIKLKEKYQDDLVVFDYHMDILTEPNTKNTIIRKFQVNRAKKIVHKECQLLNSLLLPNNARQKILKQNQVIFTDFPVYVPNIKEAHTDFQYNKDFYNVAYIGTLNQSNRNPAYAIQFFEELNKISEKKFQLHFWGNIESSIMCKLNELDWVYYHGFIDNTYVMDLLKRADYLINITNENTFNMLPSKIMQMFVAQRPIFNFVKNRGDCSLAYFEKYGHAMNIYEDTSLHLQIQAAINFAKVYETHTIAFPDELIRESTPGCLVDKIERRIFDESFKK